MATVVSDHPVEDVMGDEIQRDDVYCVIGEDIVLEQNLKHYLIKKEVPFFQAQ